jgi:hypothetical protein
MRISNEVIVKYFMMHLTYVEISKIAGVTPQRIKQIVERGLDKKTIKLIKEERSLYKAIWSRTKKHVKLDNQIINEAKKYVKNRAKVLRKCDEREINFD